MEKVANVILAGKLTDEQKFYGTCVIYGMDVEGQFDETCRILYALLRIAKGQDTKLTEAWEHKIWDVRNEMKVLSDGKSEVLFLGWNDNHLRNAIFHMRLRYDAVKTKMHFEDSYPGKPEWQIELTLDQFRRSTSLISDVTFVFLHMFLILGARDMALSPDPFEKGLTTKTRAAETQ